MSAVPNPERVSLNRLHRLRERILRNEMSEARGELDGIHAVFQGTRQALAEKLGKLADLSLRPALSNGEPMGTVGYHLLCRLQYEKVPKDEWVEGLLYSLSKHKNTLACVQVLEWLLDTPVDK